MASFKKLTRMVLLINRFRPLHFLDVTLTLRPNKTIIFVFDRRRSMGIRLDKFDYRKLNAHLRDVEQRLENTRDELHTNLTNLGFKVGDKFITYRGIYQGQVYRDRLCLSHQEHPESKTTGIEEALEIINRLANDAHSKYKKAVLLSKRLSRLYNLKWILHYHKSTIIRIVAIRYTEKDYTTYYPNYSRMEPITFRVENECITHGTATATYSDFSFFYPDMIDITEEVYHFDMMKYLESVTEEMLEQYPHLRRKSIK